MKQKKTTEAPKNKDKQFFVFEGLTFTSKEAFKKYIEETR